MKQEEACFSSIEKDELQKKIDMIMRQTDYTDEQTRGKLIQFNDNHLLVIKDYLGIPEKKTETVKSVNQEIYKQIRYNLDGAMRDYNNRTHKL